MVVDKINKILGEEILKQPKSEQSYREILYPYMSDFYMKLGIQIIFGLLILSFYHPYFIVFSSILLLVIFIIFKKLNIAFYGFFCIVRTLNV